MHHQPRHEREVAAKIFVDMAEAGHDNQHQEQHDQAPGNRQYHRIDRGMNDLALDQFNLGLVFDIARQHLSQRPRLFAGTHGCDVKSRKVLRQLSQRVRQGVSLIEE